VNNYLGDYAEDADVYIVFDTADSSGASVTATVAVADIEVYRQNTGAINLTQRSSTAGFTLDVDHDAMTGTHMVAIDTSDNTDAGFFTTAYDYFVKLNTVTVDGQSISKWIGHFSIQNRYSTGALRPTTAGRTLDVSTTGEAGLDFANVNAAPTGFIAATFPSGTIANTTNITSATGVTVSTVSDKTGYSISGAITTLDGLNNVAATDIVSAGAITTLAGAVANVDLVDVTTTNSDMVDNPLDAAGHRAALGLAAANLDTQLADIPTVAEFNARTQPTADYFDWTTDTVANVTLCATTTNLTNAPTNGDLTATMKTSVNTEVSDVLKTDTVTLPGQVAPPLAPTFEEMISWLYKVLRNRTDQTASLWQLYADNETTVDAKATVSDNGSTAVKQEIVAGP
jgi:hypothetical protein